MKKSSFWWGAPGFQVGGFNAGGRKVARRLKKVEVARKSRPFSGL